MPYVPSMGDCRMTSSRLCSLPGARRICTFPSEPTTAMPAESYPRYSRRRSPSRIRGTTFLGPMYPTIPHTGSSPDDWLGDRHGCPHNKDTIMDLRFRPSEARCFLKRTASADWEKVQLFHDFEAKFLDHGVCQDFRGHALDLFFGGLTGHAV